MKVDSRGHCKECKECSQWMHRGPCMREYVWKTTCCQDCPAQDVTAFVPYFALPVPELYPPIELLIVKVHYSGKGPFKNMSRFFRPNLTPSLPSVTNCHTWLNLPIINMSEAIIPPTPNCMHLWLLFSPVITKPAKSYSTTQIDICMNAPTHSSS